MPGIASNWPTGKRVRRYDVRKWEGAVVDHFGSLRPLVAGRYIVCEGAMQGALMNRQGICNEYRGTING